MGQSVLGLGIETSCDETSLSIVRDGKDLVSLKIYSQWEKHAAFRGVVPELAARAHLEKINLLYHETLDEANISPDDLSFVAVTAYPGLIGSLAMGAQFARTFSLVFKKPIVSCDHLESHLSVVRLEDKQPRFPYIGLLLSGGNSSLYLVHDFGKMEKIGDTLDDALGEAFDKVGSILGLDYPSGAIIENLATEYLAKNPDFKRLFPKLLKEAKDSDLSFSFSGIKTAVLQYVQKEPTFSLGEVCASFQESCFELVFRNVKKAVRKYRIPRIVAGGGVLANASLRKGLSQLANTEDIEIFYPDNRVLSTDNAAMVACLGYFYYTRNWISPLDFKVSPRWMAPHYEN